ncbi:MAG: hypothetical protein ACI9VR_003600, partial [Cognaticolwellia sp.]
ALSGAGPESLEEEVAVMAQTSPGLLPVLLNALPDAVLCACLPKVLAYRAVRDWLLMTRPDVLGEIEGGAELLIDGLIPVGHSLKLSLDAELDEKFKLAGAGSVQLTRISKESWGLVIDAEIAVMVGQGHESMDKNALSVGAVNGKLEADADLGIGQSFTANFSSDVTPDELMQALRGQLDVALLKSLVAETLTSLVPDSVSVECSRTADLEGKGDVKILSALAPALHSRLYEVSMTFQAGLSDSSRMTVTDQGLVTNEYSIEATTTIGPTLRGLLPNAMDLQRVATQESWSMTAVFEQGKFKHIVVNEDMNDMLSQRIYTDPKDLLSTQKDRYMGAGERLRKLAGGMSVTVREALPEEEVGQVSAQLQSVRLSGAAIDCDYQLQQTVRFKAGQEIPDYLNTSNFAGSDLALFQGLVEIAHGGSAGVLNLDQETARSMLEIEPIRLVGAETAKKKIDDGAMELVGQISHSFDVSYTGPTKLF